VEVTLAVPAVPVPPVYQEYMVLTQSGNVYLIRQWIIPTNAGVVLHLLKDDGRRVYVDTCHDLEAAFDVLYFEQDERIVDSVEV
jgi:hypothetical protein